MSPVNHEQLEQNRTATLMGFGAGAVQFEPDTTPAGDSSLLIGRAKLQNFGSHKDTEIAFTQPVTFFVGPNGGGKSTIAEALLWALTGKFARGLDGRGAGVRELMTTGAARMRVTMAVRGAGELQREVRDTKAALKLADQGVEEPDPQLAVYARMRTTEGRLRAVFHGATLLDADHATAKELLLDVLQVRVPIGEELLSLPQLDARYQQAFEDRRDAKRERAELRVPPRPDQEAPDVAKLEAQLATLRDEERTLIASSADANATRRQLEARRDELQIEIVPLEQRITGYGYPHEELDILERRLQVLTTPPADVDTTAAAEETELAELQARLADNTGRLRMLSGSLAGIEQHAPDKGCVLNAEIPCRTPAKEFTTGLAGFRKEIKQLERQVKDTSARVDLLTGLKNGRAQAEGERLRSIAALEQQRSILTNRARDLQGDTDRRTELLAAMATVREALEACGPAAAENPALTTLRDRIRKGEEMVPKARAVVDAWTKHRDASAKADALVAKVARLEQLVEDLGPKGKRVDALRDALAGFTTRINTYITRFGLALEFELDPWTVRVNGRPALRLSTSERLRVGICLQLALAEVSGLQFAVFDNTEWLVTPEARTTFNALAITWAKEQPGRQVLVIAAKEDSWQLPVIPGVAAYRVRQDAEGISRVVLEQEGTAAA